MDIREWPLGRIMQLPDHCFGRRWTISVSAIGPSAAAFYDISEAAFPERFVVWSVSVLSGVQTGPSGEVSLSMGDVLPANDAQFDALPPLLEDFGARDTGRFVLYFRTYHGLYGVNMRVPVMASGRRLVGRFFFDVECPDVIAAIVVVSSIPTEVPDCLISV